MLREASNRSCKPTSSSIWYLICDHVTKKLYTLISKSTQCECACSSRNKPSRLRSLLQPTEVQQAEALLNAMADILWMISERTKVCVVLPGEVAHIVHSQTYFLDGVTEKLMLFDVHSLEDLQILLKRYLYFVSERRPKIGQTIMIRRFDIQFTDETGSGALLFLYCAVMTRTPTKYANLNF